MRWYRLVIVVDRDATAIIGLDTDLGSLDRCAFAGRIVPDYDPVIM